VIRPARVKVVKHPEPLAEETPAESAEEQMT